ncbi:hypothetical protein DFH06DRAFT_1478001 [Mycena polygramma]|nr:hypothetical protein DFH06DRAFT_1478001 [Mycena polygramma]
MLPLFMSRSIFFLCVLASSIEIIKAGEVVPLSVICTNTDYRDTCVKLLSHAPFVSGQPIGCAHMTAPFIQNPSTGHSATDGYTCFLYPAAGCVGERLVINGQIPMFVDPGKTFYDKALSCFKDSHNSTTDTRAKMLVYGGLYRFMETTALL